MDEIRLLNSQELAAEEYQTLTPHPLHNDNISTIVALGALKDGRPVGLVAALLMTKALNAEVLSLYIKPEYRNQHLATRLLEELEIVLRQRKCSLVCMNYPVDTPSTKIFEKILTKLHWGKPFPHIQRLFFDAQRFHPAWVKQLSWAPDFSLFPWTTLTTTERALLQQRAAQGAFPAAVSPFNEESLLEPLNSLGLRHQGDVIGWIITHRVEPNTIRYTSLYIHPRYKKYGIQLLSASIKLQQKSPIPWAIFDVNLAQTPSTWEQFVRKRLAPYAQKITLFNRTWKDLQTS